MSVYEHLVFHAALRMSKGKFPSTIAFKQTSKARRRPRTFSLFRWPGFKTTQDSERLYLGKRLELLSGNSYFEPFLRE